MKNIDSITCFKGICALIVCFIHFKIIINNFNVDLSCLFFSVHFLFVISGYIIFIKYFSEIYTINHVLHFLKKRFFRLYPLHLLTLLLFLLLEIAKFIAHNYYGIKPNYDTFVKNNLESFIYNIFLVHNIYGNPLSFNGPSWAVGAEFFSYIIFSPVIFFFKKSINILFVVLILLYSKNYSLFNFYSIWGFSTNFNCLYDFTVGGLFGSIFIKKDKNFLNFKLFTIILLLIFIVYNKYYLALVPFLFGYILLLSSSKGYSFYSKIIFNRLFFIIGKISYSIYLMHSLVLWITIQFFNIVLKINVFGFEIFKSLLFLVLLYILTFIISYASFQHIENIYYKKI